MIYKSAVAKKGIGVFTPPPRDYPAAESAQSMNSSPMDSSWLMRRMLSAMSSATLS